MPVYRGTRLFAAMCLACAAACNTKPEYAPPEPVTSAATSSAPSTPSATASAPPTASVAEARPDAAADAAASAAVAADAGPSGVKVVNIGMHVGGGPNDAATKEPVSKSVEPHFDEFRKCFARVYDQKKSGDIGVDLLIPETGGKAQVTSPARTSLKGERFDECVVDVYKAIEFLKPRTGRAMKVSYSLRFTP